MDRGSDIAGCQRGILHRRRGDHRQSPAGPGDAHQVETGGRQRRRSSAASPASLEHRPRRSGRRRRRTDVGGDGRPRLAAVPPADDLSTRHLRPPLRHGQYHSHVCFFSFFFLFFLIFFLIFFFNFNFFLIFKLL